MAKIVRESSTLELVGHLGCVLPPSRLQLTKDCLTNIGIDADGQKEVVKLVASIMHLLNVGFQQGETKTLIGC